MVDALRTVGGTPKVLVKSGLGRPIGLSTLLMCSGAIDLPRSEGFATHSLGLCRRFVIVFHSVCKACFSRRNRRKPGGLC